MNNITLTAEQLARRELYRAFRGKYKTTMEFTALYPNEARELILLDAIHDAMQTRIREDEKYDALMKTGKCAADALREMVAALECDYDRLEELKEERGDLNDSINETEQDSAERELALIELKEWDSTNKEELDELTSAAGECTSQDEARERIQEDALSVEVRADWHEVGGDSEPTDFTILLTTGGPAVRIMGELQDGEPHRAWLEVQDWFQPWTEYRDDGLSSVLLAYAGCFYFGEG